MDLVKGVSGKVSSTCTNIVVRLEREQRQVHNLYIDSRLANHPNLG